MTAPIRVVIANDHTLVREAIVHFLNSECDIETVASVRSGREVVASTRELQPDVVVIDLPEDEALQSARIIFEETPVAKVLFLASTEHAEPFFKSISAGASGYLVKFASFNDLVTAIRTLASGKAFIWPSFNTAIVEQIRSAAPASADDQGYSQLSDREREVLKLIAAGLPVRRIADRLVVTVSTVQSHRTHILEKLRLRSTADLVRYAIRLGLIDP